MTPLRLRARTLRNRCTDAERHLWRHLRASQPGCRFRRQVPVCGYVADFLAPSIRLIVELDGGQHLEQRDYDQVRTQTLQQRGYTVLRFWNDEALLRTAEVMEAIHAEVLRLQAVRGT